MINIKCFCSNATLVDNTLGVVNTVGELSAWSTTYSKDRTMYFHPTNDELVLTSFSSKKDGKHYNIPLTTQQHILDVSKWVYDTCIAKGGEVYANELLADILVKFGKVANTFQCGVVVKDAKGIWMPSWISWKTTAKEETNIRIWFSDESFRETYDEYEIVVVPPIAVLDDFFKVSNNVKTTVEARTLPERMDDIQAAKQELPETIIRTEKFDYVDPLLATNKIATHWDVIIYGDAGNNVDSVKDAIIDYILKNTKKTREEWTAIFPDIFKRTEFVLFPHWNNYAMPEKVTEAGIYSPIVTVSKLFEEVKPFVADYPEGHVREHMQVFSHPYKAIAITSVAGNENRDNLYKLTNVFPDYIAQASTSQDFNRQQKNTREWAELLNKMLLVAEEMTEYSDVPRGMTKLKRHDKTYLVINYGNIHYLVVAKMNFKK